MIPVVRTGLVLLAASAVANLALAQCPAGGYPPPAPPPYQYADGKQYQPNVPSPSTPGPGAPAAPAPKTPAPAAPNPSPTTGGPSAPTATAVPRTAPRGLALDFRRGATSRDRLKIDWLHPVPPPREVAPTSSQGPMTVPQVLRILWEDGDDRPLLVLRECTACSGGDDALLNRAANNETTALLTKWFRAVRLPPNVTHPAHPFYRLFADQVGKMGKTAVPHVFLLADPASEPVLFDGQQTPSDIQKAMFEVLGRRYAGDPRKAVKQWLQVLDAFDSIDARQDQIEEQLAEARASDGPDSDRAKKLAAERERLAADRKQALEREAKLRDLGLMSMSRVPLQTAAK